MARLFFFLLARQLHFSSVLPSQPPPLPQSVRPWSLWLRRLRELGAGSVPATPVRRPPIPAVVVPAVVLDMDRPLFFPFAVMFTTESSRGQGRRGRHDFARRRRILFLTSSACTCPWIRSCRGR
ncbi:hypothetical protein BRADI_5g10676v3 [Brachypodium distachyon]|uniref:Secreted protein n=1 Tax=Brachypodium distachyon TaxID=15368 RepID=A0A0Q3GPF0_BRADI|nr:hypothetical protein BRADI_5g10676v3 [Brachypodium distachyon]